MTKTPHRKETTSKHFNSHPHKEDDRYLYFRHRMYEIFQLTSSQGGWLHQEQFYPCWKAFQLTSSQGGWQATGPINLKGSIKFQLTSSQGGWRKDYDVQSGQEHISTHILTRRMTCAQIWTSLIIHYFNSHPHKEDDLCKGHRLSAPFWYFNSHPHKEDDLCPCRSALLPWYFNSHPHKEDDRDGNLYRKKGTLFQLTSSQGGWRLLSMQVKATTIFQLTSSQGGWRFSSGLCWRPWWFQLTSSQGGWPLQFSINCVP